MKKRLLISVCVLAFITVFVVQGGNKQTLTFRFVPGNDMFYIPWGGTVKN